MYPRVMHNQWEISRAIPKLNEDFMSANFRLLCLAIKCKFINTRAGKRRVLNMRANKQMRARTDEQANEGLGKK